MSLLNLYYRALKSYRDYTLKEKACVKQRQLIKQYPSEDDKVETVRSVCTINEDWVLKIEELLPFVEKAISEERQFIKNEGEVLDIEKIKRVSKESVEHLARHSEFITRVPEDGKDIVPDKIYMVERLSDYAVYENRFLYMLLCYLRDFIDIRLKKIKELGTTYKANTVFNRSVRTPHGTINFQSTYSEISKKDPYSEFNQDATGIIERIESCQHITASLLQKPLMVIVSKSPMIKPPITKTNVLKMNTKFKNSVALYEYLSAYHGLGYTIEEVKKTISPFTEELSDELSELVNITSFLTYKYGNNLSEKLKEEFKQEEKKKEEEKRLKLLKSIEDLKARVAKKEISIEEYLVSLESAFDALKTDNERLLKIEKEHEILTLKHEELKKEKIELNTRLTESEREVKSLNDKIEDMITAHNLELMAAEERRIAELDEQKRAFDEQEGKMLIEFDQKMTEQKLQFTKDLNAERAQAEVVYGELKDEFIKVTKEKDLVSARLHGVQKQNGIEIDGDFTNEESFAELEREFMAFYDMFNEQWKQTKKKIRKDAFWKKLGSLRDEM